ncbi:unnamed protein product [Rhizoctonia solani]|uniref:Uncharacterized protein n=1 Tax=Rhizoctonia solani TaxID=456999 RepID=A0A8H3H8R6_9AGAM|nr:unnamed protein product [Rhizoctonia solani]
MGNDTKAEPGSSPKLGLYKTLSPEIKAEVASLVQAALTKIQQPGYEFSIAKTTSPIVEISTADIEAETERKYKEIVSTLEAKLSESNKQLESSYRDLSDVRDQLEKQRAKSVQLEQRILQMCQAEDTHKSTLVVLRADRDKALARGREALLNRDRAAVHNTQLSNQLTELQSDLDLKTAQLNDAAYLRQQLETRVDELSKENMSLRRAMPTQGAPIGASTGAPIQSGVATGAATSPQSAQPPSNLYFSVPVAGAARRHTAPNIYPQAAPATRTVPSSLPLNRPPKRARADSNGSVISDGTQSRVSSGSSMVFALRPVKLESAESTPSTSTSTIPSNHTGYSQYQSHSPISPTAPTSPYYTQSPQQRGTYTTPIQYQNQAPYHAQAVIPQGPSSASPAMATAPSVTRAPAPTMASTPAQMVHHAPTQRVPSVQQFISQMYNSSPTGFLECRICKVRPLGHPTVSGAPMPPSVIDLLAHAEKYHGITIAPNSTQQPQTWP